MTETEVRILAITLMQKHGLSTLTWKFAFDNARSRLGYCSHKKKTISLSRNYLKLPEYDDEEIRDTILHEIAHGLVGRKNGHNHVWQQKAIEIGCNGERLYHGEAHVMPKYKGTCPRCGKVILRHRRKTISCSRCDSRFNKELLFVWELNNINNINND
jgi:predicted SprT family Zn-dependent metalloprotease